MPKHCQFTQYLNFWTISLWEAAKKKKKKGSCQKKEEKKEAAKKKEKKRKLPKKRRKKEAAKTVSIYWKNEFRSEWVMNEQL